MNHVTLVFPVPGGTESYIRLPWVKNKAFKHYLRDPAVRRYGLIGLLTRAKAYGNRRRKLGFRSTLEQDETIQIVPVRALS